MFAPIASILTYLVAKFGRSAVKTGILATMKAAKWVLFLAFYGLVLAIFSVIYELITDLLNLIMNPSTSGLVGDSGCTLDLAGWAFQSLGVYDAINGGLPALVSAVTFLLSVYLYSFAMSLKDKLERDTKDMLSLI